MTWKSKTYTLKHPIERDDEPAIETVTIFNRLDRVGTLRKAARTVGKDANEQLMLIALLGQCLDVDQEVFDEMHYEDMEGLTELINAAKEEEEGKTGKR